MKLETLFLLLMMLLLAGCQQQKPGEKESTSAKASLLGEFTNPAVVVLGVAQDAGYPQAGCQKACCAIPIANPAHRNSPVSMALVDTLSKQWWLFEATPEIGTQLANFHQAIPGLEPLPTGIFLTHAHIGHYSGLIQFGREVMGTNKVPVYAMPRMRIFLAENGPWSQLVALQNVVLQPLKADSSVQLTEEIAVTPFQVPHRDEFSETVGFHIKGERKSMLFIPDIDKWGKWDKNLAEELKKVDIAFLDATFFENGELPGRDMSEIPHPFVTETMDLLKNSPIEIKSKVRFIHFNHTNPLNFPDGIARQKIREKGFDCAQELEVIGI